MRERPLFIRIREAHSAALRTAINCGDSLIMINIVFSPHLLTLFIKVTINAFLFMMEHLPTLSLELCVLFLICLSAKILVLFSCKI